MLKMGVQNSASEELQKYAEKYPDFYDKKNRRFTDYWWVEKGANFNKLADQTNFPKDYMYKETSSTIHMSLFNSVTYVGHDQTKILIGQTYDGVEKAGWYSMLCFCMAMDLFKKIYNVELDDLISRGQELVKIIN